MRITLNNILIESTIDNLNIPKLDKGILKAFHILRNEKIYVGDNEFEMVPAEKIIKAGEMLGVTDYQKLYSLSKFYQKYGNILFGDIPEIDDDIDINYEEDEEMIRGIMYDFFYKNYNNKEVYRYNGLYSNTWFTEVMMSPQEAYLEEVYSINFTNDSDTYPPCALYSDVLPNPKNKKIGVDYIIQDDEFALFNGKGKYQELMKGEWIDIDYPTDLKHSTLTKYFDELINKIVEKVIKPNDYMFDEFMKYMNNK